MSLKNTGDIWVFVDQVDGDISESVFELLSKAREIKNKDTKVCAILLTDELDVNYKNLNKYGAEDIIVVENEDLKDYNTINYSQVLFELVNKYNPSIFLFSSNPIGRDLAPRLMAKLECGLTADCVDLELGEDGILKQIKPSYGGNIMCNIIIPKARPQMATVRPKVFEKRTFEKLEDISLIMEDISFVRDDKIEQVELSESFSEKMPLADEKIVVSAGRGIETEADFDIIQSLSDKLGARVAGSRPLVDKGFIGHDDQIGQSGNTIGPELLFSIAISGAVQYAVGVENAKLSIAINKNEDAPIFESCDYGVVGDYKVLIPQIIKEIENRNLK